MARGWINTALAVFALLAVGVASSGQKFDYSCKFARNAWKPGDWLMVKSPRWGHKGAWVQEATCIANATPEGASDEDLAGPKAPETYTSMVLKQKVGGKVSISATVSFDDKFAPLIVLADTLGADVEGYPEYRDHTEIVAYNGGLNVWQHYFRDGKPSWTKLAWCDFPLKPRTKYALNVTVSGKQIQVSVDGRTFGCTNPDLPDTYQVGITGCEGRNRFYAFRVAEQ